MDFKKYGIWLLIAGLILLGIYGSFNPAEYAFFPPCPFRALTGWQCPGCGSQRAVHHLLNLNLSGAFSQNPLLVLSIPYLLFGFWLEWSSAPTRRVLKWKEKYYGKNAAWLAFSILICFWIGRNLVAW